EFERTSTSVVNAVLTPVFVQYLKTLKDDISTYGNPSMSVMSNSGGLISHEEAMSKPVAVIESGPAAGVIASNEFAKQVGITDLISFDMGGTTAKAGTVLNNTIEITTEYEVGGSSHHGRIVKGSGYPVRYPFIDLAEVSAGGGTIIWKDSVGAINAGPMSAGADPGPACYGKGGEQPTITDANLYLGIISDRMSGSGAVLNKGLAAKALKSLGDPLEVAIKARHLVNLEMARAVRLVTVERGLDPSKFTLFGFGGAGPQHVCYIAEDLGITRVIIPPEPGLFSALGLLLSDWKYEMRRSYPKNVRAEFDEMKNELTKRYGTTTFQMFADCRYRGQGSEITVPVSNTDTVGIEENFRNLHLQTYGFMLDRPVEIFTIRVFGLISRSKPDVMIGSQEKSRFLQRKAVIRDQIEEITVYNRASLIPGEKIKGPVLIDEPGTTTVVPDGWTVMSGEKLELRVVRE
ncbi:MAG TPA: hydantoinase/oxoprolinase family protein, partial [Thermoplasmataceae archaeon]|nr:hydantoinase/oxoprolinase family protein [Thermoplasmataceae archaeon]